MNPCSQELETCIQMDEVRYRCECQPGFTKREGRCEVLECKEDEYGMNYRGFMNVTMKQSECLPWISYIWSSFEDADFPDGSVAKAKNYCRNPDGTRSGPWCYVNKGFSRVVEERCAIGKCQDCTPGAYSNQYSGRNNLNELCMKWDYAAKVYPNLTSPFTLWIGTDELPENLCRNPKRMRKKPFCIISSGQILECEDVPFCFEYFMKPKIFCHHPFSGECNDGGCLWDKYSHPQCFYKPDICSKIPVSQRVVCYKPGTSMEECNRMGCCYDKDAKICFHPEIFRTTCSYSNFHPHCPPECEEENGSCFVQPEKVSEACAVGLNYRIPCDVYDERKCLKHGCCFDNNEGLCYHSIFYDMDECKKNPFVCPNGDTCINTVGSYLCKASENKDPCRINPYICAPGSKCINGPSSYSCKKEIFLPMPDPCKNLYVCPKTSTCIREGLSYMCKPKETDMCDKSRFLCPPSTTCVSNGFSYTCKPNAVETVDPCRKNPFICPKPYTCISTGSSYACKSKTVDKCSIHSYLCPSTTTCVSVGNTYKCQPKNVREVGMCERNPFTCPAFTTCVNSGTSYVCKPKSTLTEINPCKNRFTCPPTSTCINKGGGSYSCEVNSISQVKNPCNNPFACPPGNTCINQESFHICKPKFTKQDTDPCKRNPFICPPLTTCFAKGIDYVCRTNEIQQEVDVCSTTVTLCPPDNKCISKGNSYSCEPEDLCKKYPYICPSDTVCVSSVGSYTCEPVTSQLSDSCKRNLYACPAHTKCVSKGLYHICEEYVQEDICSKYPFLCPEGTVCVSTIGSYTCESDALHMDYFDDLEYYQTMKIG